MGLFDFLRSQRPDWSRALPPAIQLSASQITRLEHLRLEAQVPHTDFALFVRSHPKSSRMIQRQVYHSLRQQDPGAPELVILGQLIYSRVVSAVMSGGDLWGLGRYVSPMNPEPTIDAVDATVAIMRAKNLTTIEKVLDAIAQEEDKLPSIPPAAHLTETARKAGTILAESVP